MDKSLSLRYGGSPVSVEECDEKSYKRLILVCPECLAPVFYHRSYQRKGYHRQTKEQQAQIWIEQTQVKAYFSHFPEHDREAAALCETKARKKSDREYRQIEQKAVIQRRREIEQRIADLLMFNPETGADLPFMLEQAHLELQRWQPKQSLVTKYLKSWTRQLRSCQSLILEQFSRLQQHQAHSSLLEDRLHQEVCQEVVRFLLSPKNTRIFERFCLLALYEAVAFALTLETGKTLNVYDYSAKKLINLGILLNFEGKNPFSQYSLRIELRQSLLKIASIRFARLIFNTSWAEGFSFYDRTEAKVKLVESQYMGIIDPQGSLVISRKDPEITDLYLGEHYRKVANPLEGNQNVLCFESLSSPKLKLMVYPSGNLDPVRGKHNNNHQLALVKDGAGGSGLQVLVLGYTFNNYCSAHKKSSLMHDLKKVNLAADTDSFASNYPGIFISMVSDKSFVNTWMAAAEYFLNSYKMCIKTAKSGERYS